MLVSPIYSHFNKTVLHGGTISGKKKLKQAGKIRLFPEAQPSGIAVGPRQHLSSNGDLDLDTGLNVDNDRLDNLSGCMQVNQALVNAQLVHVPGLGALTARSLAGSDLKVLGL